jgi:hypothetical protein
VTYAREEDASKALKNTSPTIDGRRTNCNLAAFGNVRRDRPGARNNFEGRNNYGGRGGHNGGPYYYDQQQMMMYGNMQQQMDNSQYGGMGFPGAMGGSPNQMGNFNQMPYMAFPAMMMQPAAAGMMMTPQGFMMGENQYHGGSRSAYLHCATHARGPCFFLFLVRYLLAAVHRMGIPFLTPLYPS